MCVLPFAFWALGLRTAQMLAALNGRRPDQITCAALTPNGRKTRANAKRLSRRRL